MKKITKEDVIDVIDSCFIAKYINLFNNYLQNLSPHTRDAIRKNKELDEMYDLFLDFIIDASQHLDYKIAKEAEKDISESNG